MRTDVHGISERLYSWKTSAISSGGAGHAPAAQQHLALARPQQPGDALQQRRLAAAGRADDADELAVLDRERDVADRVRRLLAGAVRLAEAT